jgi:hypothetical protein
MSPLIDIYSFLTPCIVFFKKNQISFVRRQESFNITARNGHTKRHCVALATPDFSEYIYIVCLVIQISQLIAYYIKLISLFHKIIYVW